MSHYILDCDPGHDDAIALRVAMECRGELTRGITVYDHRGMAPGNGMEPVQQPNTKVASDVRADDIIEVVLDTLADFP